MKPPSSITELQRFMGMVNQMSKFSPSIAQISKTLCDLRNTKNSWAWIAPQEESFRNLKEEISFTRVCTIRDQSHINVSLQHQQSRDSLSCLIQLCACACARLIVCSHYIPLSQVISSVGQEGIYLFQFVIW